MTEQLSNLMDEQVDSASLDQILDAAQDPQILSKWQRYNLASSLLKGEVKDVDMKFDIADKVMSRIASEANSPQLAESNETFLEEHKSKPSRMVSWGGWAIAASLVGGIYFFNSGLNTTTTDTLNPQITSQQTPVNIHWQAPIDVEARLNALLVEHSEFTGVADMNGLASYSKFVAYQN